MEQQSPEINTNTYRQLIFDKGGKNTEWRKVSSVSCVGKAGQSHVNQRQNTPHTIHKVKATQLGLTLQAHGLYNTVHGILQARILEWVAFPFSRGSSQPRDWTQVSHMAGRFFTSRVTKQTQNWLTGKRMYVKNHSVLSDSVTPQTVAPQAPLSMGFSSQKYWNGLPFLSPWDLPNPGIEPGCLALQARLSTMWTTREVTQTILRRHHKTPKREQRQNILWHKSYWWLLRVVSQDNRNKSKNKQMGPNQTYKLLYSKGNQKQN